MIEFTIREAAEICRGTLNVASAHSDDRFVGISTDTRTLKPGQAFVALRGEQFDGHAFIDRACELGAKLLIVSEAMTLQEKQGVSLLRVPDTRRALGELAQAWRRRVNPKVIAITGSVGKTTTKELSRHIFSQVGKTLANLGNLNNDIGLPLTLNQLALDDRFLVTEMGMNAPREIAYLADLAEPDIGVITTIAPVHLEGLGSLEAIAAAKAELLVNLRTSGGIVVVPSDQPLLVPFCRAISRRCLVTFGAKSTDTIQLLEILEQNESGSHFRMRVDRETVTVMLPLVGAHNIHNALAATGAAFAAGIDVEIVVSGLETKPVLKHRSTILSLKQWHVFDDCYNASPVTMKAAALTVKELAGSRPYWFVVGVMRELGESSREYHVDVGRYFATLNPTRLVTVGDEASAIADGALQAGMATNSVYRVATHTEAAQQIQRNAPAGTWVLVKGSRGAEMEKVIEHLST